MYNTREVSERGVGGWTTVACVSAVILLLSMVFIFAIPRLPSSAASPTMTVFRLVCELELEPDAIFVRCITGWKSYGYERTS